MHARYYSPNLGRFLSVDPAGGSVGSSQSWNRYSYVLNNPLNLVDPDGEESYLVSRPLEMMPGQYAHCFIATHAAFPGDPNAIIVSYGQRDDWTMGIVDLNTRNEASRDTHQTDVDAWASMRQGNPDVAARHIPAEDHVVLENAFAVMENQDYSAATSVGGIPPGSYVETGLNSNSAAVAVAEESAGQNMHPPGHRTAAGQSKSSKVQFDRDGDGLPDERNYTGR
jgi:uncharacterized protein RhaS with RHS repeats